MEAWDPDGADTCCDQGNLHGWPLVNAATRPVAIDLFSGAGGMSLGLEQAGFQVAAAVEYDPVHAATHEFNFPRCSTLCASVANIDADEILSRSGLRKGGVDLEREDHPAKGLDDRQARRERLAQPPSYGLHRIVGRWIPVLEWRMPGMAVGAQGALLNSDSQVAKSGYRATDPAPPPQIGARRNDRPGGEGRVSRVNFSGHKCLKIGFSPAPLDRYESAVSN